MSSQNVSSDCHRGPATAKKPAALTILSVHCWRLDWFIGRRPWDAAVADGIPRDHHGLADKIWQHSDVWPAHRKIDAGDQCQTTWLQAQE